MPQFIKNRMNQEENNKPALFPFHPKEQATLAQFAKTFLSPAQDIWALRFKTLAAANLKIPKSVKQLVRFPDDFIPHISKMLESKKMDSIYPRYVSLGWQMAHTRQPFEIGLSLVSLQMLSLLSAVDELVFNDLKAKKADKNKIIKTSLQPGLALFSKFQHNCRVSFLQGYFNVQDAELWLENNGFSDQLERVNAKRKEESFLREILCRTAQSLDFQDLFLIFSNSLRGIGNYDRISITLSTENLKEVKVFAVSSESPSCIKEGTIIAHECSLSSTLKNKKPVIHSDLSKNGKCGICTKLYREGISSFIVVPLLIGEEAIGTLNVGSKNRNFFEEKEIPFFQKLADGLAVAVRNAAKYSKTLEDLEIEQYSSAIISKIRSSLDVNEIMENVCKELGRFYSADRALFAEVFEPEGVATMTHEFLNPESEIDGLSSVKGTYKLDDFKEMVKALRAGEVVAANVEDNTHPVIQASQALFKSLQIKTLCIVPLFVFEKYWGALTLEHCARTYQWKKSQIEMLKRITKEISKAVELGRIYQKEKEHSGKALETS